VEEGENGDGVDSLGTACFQEADGGDVAVGCTPLAGIQEPDGECRECMADSGLDMRAAGHGTSPGGAGMDVVAMDA
jgi:hypothetical protein